MSKDVWAANIKGKMFLCSISDTMIAQRLGVTRQYVSMILNGKRNPKDGRERIEAAVEALMKGE